MGIDRKYMPYIAIGAVVAIGAGIWLWLRGRSGGGGLSVTITPEKPIVNQSFTINYAGFTPNSTATWVLTPDNAVLPPINGQYNIGADGKATEVTVGIGALGWYSLVVTDTGGGKATVRFEVVAA